FCGGVATRTRVASCGRRAKGGALVKDRAGLFAIRRPAVTKHLKVLQRAGLITQGRQAQWRPCRLEAAPLKDVADWLEDYRRFWDASFQRLDEYLAELQAKEQQNDREP